MLYYFTASDKDAQKHFKDTIENPCNIKKYLNRLDVNVVSTLKAHNLDELVHMWGAIPGSSNKNRWEKIEPGDKVLAYSQGVFLYYGTIFAKTHNFDVARDIWGENNKGETWEYIYFIKDIKPVSIKAIEFSAFFGYNLNFKPQGFSNIQKDKLEIKLRKYTSIDEMINDLNNNFIISQDDEDEANSFQTSLDSDYSQINTDIEEKPEKKKKPRNNKGGKVWDRDDKKAKIAIKKAEFKCELDPDHETFISAASKKPFMEAHHIIPMKEQHTFSNNLDVVGNIICLCPNCHRVIHHAKPSIKKEILKTIYSMRQEKLELYKIYVTLSELLGFYGIK